MTQTAYGGRTYEDSLQWASFYSSCFGRTCLTYYLTCAMGLAQRALDGRLLPATDYVLPLLLLDAWDPDARLTQSQPNLNPAGWTLSTLALPWLLYPLLHAAAERLRRQGPGAVALVFAFLLCSLAAVAPAGALYLSRSHLGEGERITRSMSLCNPC